MEETNFSTAGIWVTTMQDHILSILSLGVSRLLATSIRKRQLVGDISCTTHDMVHYKDIESVVQTSSAGLLSVEIVCYNGRSLLINDILDGTGFLEVRDRRMAC